MEGEQSREHPLDKVIEDIETSIKEKRKEKLTLMDLIKATEVIKDIWGALDNFEKKARELKPPKEISISIEDLEKNSHRPGSSGNMLKKNRKIQELERDLNILKDQLSIILSFTNSIKEIMEK